MLEANQSQFTCHTDLFLSVGGTIDNGQKWQNCRSRGLQSWMTATKRHATPTLATSTAKPATITPTPVTLVNTTSKWKEQCKI